MLLTPHVLHDQRDARALTEDMREQLINAAAVPVQLNTLRAFRVAADPGGRIGEDASRNCSGEVRSVVADHGIAGRVSCGALGSTDHIHGSAGWTATDKRRDGSTHPPAFCRPARRAVPARHIGWLFDQRIQPLLRGWIASDVELVHVEDGGQDARSTGGRQRPSVAELAQRGRCHKADEQSKDRNDNEQFQKGKAGVRQRRLRRRCSGAGSVRGWIMCCGPMRVAMARNQ